MKRGGNLRRLVFVKVAAINKCSSALLRIRKPHEYEHARQIYAMPLAHSFGT